MTEYVKSKLLYWLKGMAINREFTIKGLIGGFMAMSFPHKDEYLVIICLSIFFTAVIIIAGDALKKIGCFQSLIAFSISIVGALLMHSSIPVEWIIKLFIASLALVGGEFIIKSRVIHHDYLSFDYDNRVYYSMIAFGAFQIWSSISGYSEVRF